MPGPALSNTQQRFQRARCSAGSSIADESVSLYLCKNAKRTSASSCVSLKTTSLDSSFGVGIQLGQWLGGLIFVDSTVYLGGMVSRVGPGVPDIIGSQGRILVDESLDGRTQSPRLLQHADRDACPGNPRIAAADTRSCLDTGREGRSGGRPGFRSIGMGWHRLFSVRRTDQHLISQDSDRRNKVPGGHPPGTRLCSDQTNFVIPGFGTGRIGASPQVSWAGTSSCFELRAWSQVITWPV
jgi:hypothetical protein